MDIRSSLDGLKSLLGTAPAQPPVPPSAKGDAAIGSSALGNDRATFSTAASEVSMASADSDVRAGKVAEIQQALATGTYSVPASAVASRMVDAMLAATR